MGWRSVRGCVEVSARWPQSDLPRYKGVSPRLGSESQRLHGANARPLLPQLI